MGLLRELIDWLKELWEEAEPREPVVPLEVRIVDVAEAWQVDVGVARRMVRQYAVLYGIGLDEAVDRLRGMGYAEAVREIGER